MNIDFYNVLLAESYQKEASRILKVDIDEVGQRLQELGYRHYVFGGVQHVYTKEPLTLEEKIAYEKDIRDAMNEKVRELIDQIDKEILKDLKRKT